MKQIILSLVIILNVVIASVQNYEAANWKTWLLDNPQQITIVAPPDAAKTKAELQLIKMQMKKWTKKN